MPCHSSRKFQVQLTCCTRFNAFDLKQSAQVGIFINIAGLSFPEENIFGDDGLRDFFFKSFVQ